MSTNGNGDKLSPREKAFVVAYVGPAKSNGTQAARLAGYKGNAPTLGTQAHRLLKRAEVKGAIAARVDESAKPLIASFEERDEILSGIMRDGKLDIYARVAAARELNKCHGRHSLKMIHTTRTLEEILGESWKDE
jgi:hypothetical protein